MSRGSAPPTQGRAPEVDRGAEDERLAGNWSVYILPRPTDETLSDAQAAAAWRSWWTDEAIEGRVREELEVADLIARWRIRMAGLDVSEAIDDWPRVQDIVMARKGGYQPLERTPDPWPPESLDRDAWRDDVHPYSTNVPVSFRFHPVFAPRAVAA